MCRECNVAIQTIKSITRRPWGDRPKNYNTYFYEPLESQDAINKSVHWAMGLQESFVITAGDMQLLPKILVAGHNFKKQPSDKEMSDLIAELDIRPIFK